MRRNGPRELPIIYARRSFPRRGREIRLANLCYRRLNFDSERDLAPESEAATCFENTERESPAPAEEVNQSDDAAAFWIRWTSLQRQVSLSALRDFKPGAHAKVNESLKNAARRRFNRETSFSSHCQTVNTR